MIRFAKDGADGSLTALLKGNPGRIGEIAFDQGWPKSKLWHEACDERYLEELFQKEGVLTLTENTD